MKVLLILLCLMTPLLSGTDSFCASIDNLSEAQIQKGIGIIEKKAQEGDATAQYRIGVIYRKGFHVPQDKAKAFEWFRKAAEQGHVKAQYTLGIMLNKGEVGPRDYVEARKWFEKAAAQGDPHASYSLGLLYFHGRGVTKDVD